MVLINKRAFIGKQQLGRGLNLIQHKWLGVKNVLYGIIIM